VNLINNTTCAFGRKFVNRYWWTWF